MPTSEREKEIVREYLIGLQLLIRSGEEPASLGQPESLAVLVKAIAELAAMWQDATIPVETQEIWVMFCAWLVACSVVASRLVHLLLVSLLFMDETLRGGVVFSYILANT